VVTLLKDLAYIRRTKREVRTRVHAELEEQGKWRSRWWTPLILWGGAMFGTGLLIWGNDTIDLIVGTALVVPPAGIAVATVWVYWKALRILRRERLSGRDVHADP
jgi:4-amino-4-deoxy-L-arabinose transferase-like glycosyltransferase